MTTPGVDFFRVDRSRPTRRVLAFGATMVLVGAGMIGTHLMHRLPDRVGHWVTVAGGMFLLAGLVMGFGTLARMGAGIALVDPFPQLLHVPEDLAIVPFRPTIEIRPVVICPPGRPVSTAADQFINTLQTTVKALIKQSPFLKSV